MFITIIIISFIIIIINIICIYISTQFGKWENPSLTTHSNARIYIRMVIISGLHI